MIALSDTGLAVPKPAIPLQDPWAEIGARIDARMQVIHWKHKDLAKALGKHRSYVTRIINGKRKGATDLNLLGEIATALGVARDELLPDVPTRSHPTKGGASNQAGGARNQASGPDLRSSVILPTQPGDRFGGYEVRTHEAEYIARELDDIDDKALRKRVMSKCSDLIEELVNPQSPRAEKMPGRSRSRK